MTHVLSHYNQHIAKLSPCSHQSLCQMCIQLMEMGFNENTTSADSEIQLNTTDFCSLTVHDVSQELRVRLSSQFIVELLTGIYFAIFNGQTQLATQALEAVEKRSMYELWADVLLVNNAIKNSIKYNSLGCMNNKQMLISTTLLHTPNHFYSKEVITNATFKATKLPDDIEVIDDPTSNSHSNDMLKISEFELMRKEIASKMKFSRQSTLTVETWNALSQKVSEPVDPKYACQCQASTTQSNPSTKKLSGYLPTLSGLRK